MSADQRSSDHADIEQILLRYATGIDKRDWALFRTCFIDDAVGDYGDIGTFTGADNLTDFMIAAHGGFGSTNHMLTNFVIQVDGDRATARQHPWSPYPKDIVQGGRTPTRGLVMRQGRRTGEWCSADFCVAAPVRGAIKSLPGARATAGKIGRGANPEL